MKKWILILLYGLYPYFFSQVVPVLTIRSSFRLAGTCVLPTYLLSRLPYFLASRVAQMVKNLPAMQETQVQSLGREDPLEKEMAACSSTLAWRIPCIEEPGGLLSTGLQRVWHDSFTFFLLIPGCYPKCRSISWLFLSEWKIHSEPKSLWMLGFPLHSPLLLEYGFFSSSFVLH